MAEKVKFSSRFHNYSFVVEARRLNRDREVVAEGLEAKFRDGVFETDNERIIKSLRKSPRFGVDFHETKDDAELEAIRKLHSVQMNSGVRTPVNREAK
jgi:hypothetical protein